MGVDHDWPLNFLESMRWISLLIRISVMVIIVPSLRECPSSFLGSTFR